VSWLNHFHVGVACSVLYSHPTGKNVLFVIFATNVVA